jgi:hypothetical protein
MIFGIEITREEYLAIGFIFFQIGMFFTIKSLFSDPSEDQDEN